MGRVVTRPTKKAKPHKHDYPRFHDTFRFTWHRVKDGMVWECACGEGFIYRRAALGWHKHDIPAHLKKKKTKKYPFATTPTVELRAPFTREQIEAAKEAKPTFDHQIVWGPTPIEPAAMVEVDQVAEAEDLPDEEVTGWQWE